MNPCPECCRLREEASVAFSEYVLAQDELGMTKKRDKAFASKRRAFENAQGRLKEAHRREQAHREQMHRGYGQDNERVTPAQRLDEVREAVGLNDEEKVQQAIFSLGAGYNGWIKVPDEVVESILTTLRGENLFESRLAAHILNYFEFESHQLTSRQKRLVKGFLEAHGDRFTDVGAAQVVTELRFDDYLN